MANPLVALSAALAEMTEAASGTVVRVEAGRRVPSSGILWDRDGTVITAAHTVRREEEVRVVLADGTEVAARLAGRDPGTDVAVLKPAATFAAKAAGGGLRLAEGSSVRVGHLVFALGRPGRTLRATHGIVTAFGEGWRTPYGGTVDFYLETDASLPAGFSGGPLVDASGAILGMNTSAVPRGVGTTIPAATVRRVMESILSHGRVRRAYLGVNTYPVALPASVPEAAGRAGGLLVTEVEPGSPADRGGLLLGDVLLEVDGEAVSDMEGLMAALSEERAGKAVTVRVLRAGQAREAQVTLGERA